MVCLALIQALAYKYAHLSKKILLQKVKQNTDEEAEILVTMKPTTKVFVFGINLSASPD